MRVNERSRQDPRVHGQPMWVRYLMIGVACLVSLTFEVQVEATAASAPSTASIGYVEKVTGDINGIRIERHGKSIAPALLLPLQVGDRLTSLRPDNELYVQLGNHRVIITAQNSPYRIPAIDAPPGFLNRLRSKLVSVGGRLTTQYVRSSIPISTSSRGGDSPLSMPLIEDGVSRFRTTRTGLALAWDGGTAPFLVRVLAIGKQELASQHVADGVRTRVEFTRGPVPLGIIQVVVQDSAGGVVEKFVQVVPSIALLGKSKQLAQSDLPLELQTVLSANSTILANHKRWGFEAYQDIAPLADAYEPARLLRDCLEATPSCYHR